MAPAELFQPSHSAPGDEMPAAPLTPEEVPGLRGTVGCWRDGWLRGPSCLLGRSRPRRLGGGAQVVAPEAPVAPAPPGLDMLTEMGLDENLARIALQASDGDVQAALAQLSADRDDLDGAANNESMTTPTHRGAVNQRQNDLEAAEKDVGSKLSRSSWSTSILSLFLYLGDEIILYRGEIIHLPAGHPGKECFFK